MTGLREALDGIAAEAPLVDLADVAVARHRRRRRTTVALAALATAAVVGVTTAAVTLPRHHQERAVPAQQTDAVPELPDGAVGPISYAYLTPCTVANRRLDCTKVEWRVVTRAGTTYRVPQALVESPDDVRTPVAISRDGHMLAYYSRQAGAHVVRDLVNGSEVTSAAKVTEAQIGVGSMLALSDDGRHLFFDPREGSKKPGLLLDVRTGKVRQIDGRYEVVTIRNGIVDLVRYRKTDLWRTPVTGGGRPVRFKGTFIMFSEVAPDGHTVAAVDYRDYTKNNNKLTLLDSKTGRTLRKVTIRGLPRNGNLTNTGLWRSPSELTFTYQHGKTLDQYAVDITTSRAHRLTHLPAGKASLVLPGLAAN